MHTDLTAIKATLLAATVFAASSLAVSARPVQPRGTVPGEQPAAAPPKAASDLAGQDATYLTLQSKARLELTRVYERMSVIAKALSNTEMTGVAAYRNATQIEVVNMPGR